MDNVLKLTSLLATTILLRLPLKLFGGLNRYSSAGLNEERDCGEGNKLSEAEQLLNGELSMVDFELLAF
jgi:hypothetical protein